MRVPSGKIETHMPCLSRMAPCSTICSRALWPLDRSIAMARMAMRLQPTNGSHRSSFFTIQHCGGNRPSMKSVSHADWCLAMTITGKSGTFSQPSTS